MASSRSVVIAALVANGAIAVLKFVGFLLTGSPAMLSETYHSVSDTGNQVFLLIGIRFSGRDPDQAHPFGYGKAQFFYAFLVSVLLFGIAGWESAKHGYHALTHLGEAHGGNTWTVPFTDLGPYPGVWVNYIVLTGAIVFESYALWKANKGLTKEIRENEWSGYVEAFRKTADITTLTAFTEDSIALAGAAIALVGVALTQFTGMPVFDAASSLVIGLLLMGFALALAWENKRLLLGESLPSEDERELRATIERWDGVVGLRDLRTVYFGPDTVVVTADVAFEEGMETAAIDDAISGLEAELRTVHGDIGRVYIEPEPTTGAGTERRGGPSPSPAGED
jgi:cation diffusion facilitator family transporter